MIEKQQLTPSDVVGGVVILIGAGIIIIGKG
jgi:drug/metabolite transporter superfamily protein YnfA